MTSLRLLLPCLFIFATLLCLGPAAASAGASEDQCCDEALRNLLLAQSEETRDRFRQLRLKLKRLDEEDFTWLQITAASSESVCTAMACDGVADSVAKQLVALEAIERETAQDGRFKAQDRRLNRLMAIMTAITTIIGLGSLAIAYLAYRKSGGASTHGV